LVKIASRQLDNNENEEKCINNTPGCNNMIPSMRTYIQKPYPNVIIFKVDWPHGDIGSNDCLNLVASMNQYFEIGQLYNEDEKSSSENEETGYNIRAIISQNKEH